jgi:hypothetical protein
MKKIYILLLITMLSFTTQAQVVISQVYGGGGNTGATYTNDFIELFNRGNSPQDLTGWSVQYANATSATPTWQVTTLGSITLQPGQYYLIQEAGGTTGVALPTADLVPTTTINLSGTNGKVVLANSTTAVTTANPTDSQIVDKVAYGNTPTTGYEGTGPTGTALTNTTSAQRNNSGCSDTDNNSIDFTVGTPSPRNTSTPVNLCSTMGTNQNQILGLQIYPNPTKNVLNISTDSNLTKSVQVYDMIGKEVINTEVETQLNVSSLTTGLYLAKVTEDGKTSTKRLAIN